MRSVCIGFSMALWGASVVRYRLPVGRLEIRKIDVRWVGTKTIRAPSAHGVIFRYDEMSLPRFEHTDLSSLVARLTGYT